MSPRVLIRTRLYLEAVDEDVVEDDVVKVAALYVARGQLLRHLRHVALLLEKLDEAVVRHGEVLRVLFGAAEQRGDQLATGVHPPKQGCERLVISQIHSGHIMDWYTSYTKYDPVTG